MQVCGALGISVRSALPPARWLLVVCGVRRGLLAGLPWGGGLALGGGWSGGRGSGRSAALVVACGLCYTPLALLEGAAPLDPQRTVPNAAHCSGSAVLHGVQPLCMRICAHSDLLRVFEHFAALSIMSGMLQNKKTYL